VSAKVATNINVRCTKERNQAAAAAAVGVAAEVAGVKAAEVEAAGVEIAARTFTCG